MGEVTASEGTVVCCRIGNRRRERWTDESRARRSRSVVQFRDECPWPACEQKLFMSKSSQDELLLSTRLKYLPLSSAT